MSRTRPYISYTLEEIDKLFAESAHDKAILESIATELSFRNKNRKAPVLRKEVAQAIEHIDSCVLNNSKLNSKHSVDECLRQEAHSVMWDCEQRTVIELNSDVTMVVEAGPGAGKTAVACAKVVSLIEEQDLEPSKIFLISFTRTAVKELRDRIESYATKPINIAGLKILTLDSFTWQVLRGLGEVETNSFLDSYSSNIKSLIQQLHDGDPHLLDYLEEFEHVILDEGQDLVGERAELAIQLIKRLEDDCGVTIFSDSAQAIYGFTNDETSPMGVKSLTLVERINEGEIEGFEKFNLANIHRTNDKKLIRLIQSGRERILSKKTSDISDWLSMKQFINDCSHGKVGVIESQNICGKSDHLILFRTKAEVLLASGFLWSKNIAHKIRMSGIPHQVHPWIGRIFVDFEEDYLTKEVFAELWAKKLSNQTGDLNIEASWKLLSDNVVLRGNKIKMSSLREMLSRDRPPIDFLVDENSLEGPILGTIHASKGREANQVHLMLPPDKFISRSGSAYSLSPQEIAEEERVLFVGASRARKKLMTGCGSITYASRLETGRIYKKTRNGKAKRMVEVGLAGDIDIVSIGDARLHSSMCELQDWLWENAAEKVQLEANYDHDSKCYVLFVKEDGRPLCRLSKRFSHDIWFLAKTIECKGGEKRFKPYKTINNIRMVGVTTISIPEDQRAVLPAPWCHSGLILVPVISGFPTVSFSHWKK